MSLWCGACRKEIFEGFGLIYRMDLVDGQPRLPTKDKEYVPPNSAVCDRCWVSVPENERLAQVAQAAETDAKEVFAYASASSSSSPIWGSKQWSDIEHADQYVYLRQSTVETYVPKILPIILMDAKEKARA